MSARLALLRAVAASVAVLALACSDNARNDDAQRVASVPARASRTAHRRHQAVPDELIVRYRPGASRAARADLQRALGARAAREFRTAGGIQLVKLAEGVELQEAIRSATANPAVLYAEPNYLVHAAAVPDDPGFVDQWSLANTGQLGAPGADVDVRAAWDLTTGSPDVVVAVIDSGVDYRHPDLAPNIWSNPSDCDADGVDDDANEHVDDCHGIDVVDGTSDPFDAEGHGTHVAGIIAAAGSNGLGIAGVSWRSRLVACRFLDADGVGTIGGAIACLDYVAALKDRGVEVVATNNSWGGYDASRALADAIEAQRERGILFVAAAGNEGWNDDLALEYPCSSSSPNVLCVGASTDADRDATFSNVGLHTVHLLAPGEQILSTIPNGRYAAESGTSMAAPHVTGAIALLQAHLPGADWRELRGRILASVAPTARASTVTGGRLDVYRALTCQGAELSRRLQPRTSVTVASGVPVALSALHVVCGSPGGEVVVSVSPGDAVTLRDEGGAGDVAPGDGVYGAIWTPPAPGTYRLAFPGGDQVSVTVDAQLQPGFPQKLWREGPVDPAFPVIALVGDIDGDPELEIVTSGLDAGELAAFEPDGALTAGWPLPWQSVVDPPSPVYPALARMLPGLPGRQVAFTFRYRFGSQLMLYSGTTGELWLLSAGGGTTSGPPLAVDADGDGLEEIFVDPDPLSAGTGTPAAADLFGDGSLEFPVASSGLRVIDADGVILPGYPVPVTAGPPVVGDVDGDGEPEIVVAGTTGPSASEVRVYGLNGLLKRSLPLDGATPAPPALADLDQDGVPEIVVQTSGPATVEAVRGDGTSLEGWPVSLGNGVEAGGSAPVVGDVDGDGAPEVIVTVHTVGDPLQGALHVLGEDGSARPGFPKPLPIGPGAVPAIADLDRDGRNEIVVLGTGDHGRVGFHDDLWVLDLGGGPGGAVPWGQYMHDAGHTGAIPVTARRPRTYFALQVSTEGYGLVTSQAAGITCGSGCSRLLEAGSTVFLTATAASGHVLAAWGGACSGNGPTCAVTLDAARSVTAAFIPASHQVTVRRIGDGAGTVASVPAGIDCGEACTASYVGWTRVILVASPAAGFVFTGWGGACAGTDTVCDLIVDGDEVVTAEFSRPRQTVSVARLGSGTGLVASTPAGVDCGATCSASFPEGTLITLTATAATGSQFDGWGGACAGAGAGPTCTLSMDQARSVTATFSVVPPPSSFFLSVARTGSGDGTVTSIPAAGLSCGYVCTALYVQGTSVTLTATPAPGSRFDGWGGPCAGTSPTCVLVMDQARTVQAAFSPASSLLLVVTRDGAGSGTVSSSPAGIACGATCSASFVEASQVTLTASPGAGSRFDGWAGACAGTSSTCVLTMDQARNVQATFSRAPPPSSFPLVVTRDGAGSGTVSSSPAGIACGATCSASFVEASQVTLTASPATGSRFDGWSGACAGTTPACVVTMDQARDVQATFSVQGGGGGGGGGGCATGDGGGSAIALALLALALVHRRRKGEPMAKDARSWLRWCAAASVVACGLLTAGCGNDPAAGLAEGRPADASPRPIPEGLWRAPTAVLPGQGSYLYVDSDLADSLGGGRKALYTTVESVFTLGMAGDELHLRVSEPQGDWQGDFQGAGSLAPGYYGPVRRWPFHVRTVGGMSVSHDSLGCNVLSGWFVIDAISTVDGQLRSVDLRFEQHCEENRAALHGQLHWSADDAIPPVPGPTTAPPDLWQPPPELVPATGSYAYLDSPECGAWWLFVEGGAGFRFTPRSYELSVSVSDSASGDGLYWGMEFFLWPMEGVAVGTPGYYQNVNHGPREALGTLVVGAGICGRIDWYAIDRYTVEDGEVVAMDLRFGDDRPMGLHTRGKIHWVKPSPATPILPVFPPPDGLWSAPPESTPSSGSYLYLESDADDPVGLGQTLLFAPSQAEVGATLAGNRLFAHGWDESGDRPHEHTVLGSLAATDLLAELELGYYAGLTRYPYADPATGGLSWTVDERWCSALDGWFTVDSLLVSNGQLEMVDLRFEQRCAGASGTLRGQLHWTRPDLDPPAPGPLRPPPTGLWRPAPSQVPVDGSYLYVEGGGDLGGRLFTPADGRLTVSVSDTGVGFSANDSETWTGGFGAMASLARLEAGYYDTSFGSSGGPSLRVEGPGVPYCMGWSGWYVIDSITWSGTTATAVDLRFEGSCANAYARSIVRGQLHWDPATSTAPPPSAPVNPPPMGLWNAPAGATPSTGSYVYLEGALDPLTGEPSVTLVSTATARFAVRAEYDRGILVAISGDDRHDAQFFPMDGVGFLPPGYYGGLTASPSQNYDRTRGAFAWDCAAPQGWFVVDAVTRDTSGAVTALDLRFEQRCSNNPSAARHGKLHWVAGEPDPTPPAPVYPPPAGLWDAPPGATPSSGSYAYLVSALGDPVGYGRSYLYTKADAIITTSLQGGQLSMQIDAGPDTWSGSVMAPAGRALSPGYYAPISDRTYGNPILGHLGWTRGLGCANYSGWFVLDSLVTSPTGEPLSYDLRFEQHCSGIAPALRGKIHWEASDGVTPAGPRPIPAGLWSPPPGATPEGVNYVYLEGDAGIPEWEGTWLYTQADAVMNVYLNAYDTSEIYFLVRAFENWDGVLETMGFIDVPVVGYYPGPTSSTNPVLGGIAITGFSRGCGSTRGVGSWFTIDDVRVEDLEVETGSIRKELTALDLRFEQHCDDVDATLRGKIHWVLGDPTSPPDPVNPPPTGLWDAPAGATPATGDYVYLQSDPGDPIAGGRTMLYTPATARVYVSSAQNHVHVVVATADPDDGWTGNFEVPALQSSFLPGFYGELRRYSRGNPARGSMEWTAERGCDSLTGWFTLEGMTWSQEGLLTSLDLRFEQRCDGGAPALHGKVHWVAP